MCRRCEVMVNTGLKMGSMLPARRRSRKQSVVDVAPIVFYREFRRRFCFLNTGIIYRNRRRFFPDHGLAYIYMAI